MSYMRPRHWPGYEKISGSDGQWSITFALQGSFDCPTPHISFDLFHRRVPERDDNAEHPAIQPCQEGRWHVYHILIEGSEDEMKEVEAGQKRLGGAAYDWRMTMLLHESKPLNRRLVDKILRWQLSSADHPKWFSLRRKNPMRRAFYMNKDDWTNVEQVHGAHEMIFVGHPDQNVEDIVNISAEQGEELKKATKGACQSCPCEEGRTCMERVFNHGCLLPKTGPVYAIKDDCGFILIAHERGVVVV